MMIADVAHSGSRAHPAPEGGARACAASVRLRKFSTHPWSLTLAQVHPCRAQKKKGRSGERPKSREETPKEGDEYRDAVALPHCNKVVPARLIAKVKRSASLPVF